MSAGSIQKDHRPGPSLPHAVAQGFPPLKARASLTDISVPDSNGNGVYDVGDKSRAQKPVSSSDVARGLVAHLKKHPAKVVSLGELHGGHANQRYMTIIEQANRAGLKPVAAIEAAGNPDFKDLTERLYAGLISPEDYVRDGSKLLYADYEARRRTHPHGGAMLMAGAFEMLLESDVLEYFRMKPPVPVVFIDRERFKGGNRDEGMAQEILAATRRYPGRTVFAQIGVIHGGESGSHAFTDKAKAGTEGDPGVVQGTVDGARPAMTRVAAVLGRDAILSVALDETDRAGRWYLATPGGVHEIEAGPDGRPPFQSGMYDFYIRTKTRD